MRYVIERDEYGRWIVVASNDHGLVTAKVLCSSTSKAMEVFLMLEGSISLLDERTEDLLDEKTQITDVA